MRVGIDARFLTHPQEGGFKTYTQNLVRGLASLDQRNEYILYTDRRADVGLDLQANFSVKPVGGPAPLREQVLLPLAMSRDRLDAAHFLCNTAPLLSPRPLVLTVHDVIPLMLRPKSRERIGVKSRALARYWRSIMPRAARRADRIISVSESSKRDIIRLFGVSEERVVVAPPGVHPDFRPVHDPERMRRVRDAYGLPDRFIMGFLSCDPRKNARGLLDAAALAAQRIPDLGVVLICASARARSAALDLSSDRRMRLSRLRLLDPVPRSDLAAIYSLAQALVFPSFYEGFGLPVVEAMACGTPVVTSSTSSLPEVAGDAALLVDPEDHAAIAHAILRLVTDAALRIELAGRGLERASAFGQDRTVRETVAVYENLGRAARAAAQAPASPAGRPSSGDLG